MEESPSKLSKEELTMMLKMQNKVESSDTKFAEEVRKLNESFQQLKPDLAITKIVNSQLHNCFINMEKEFWVKCSVFLENICGYCGYTHLISE